MISPNPHTRYHVTVPGTRSQTEPTHQNFFQNRKIMSVACIGSLREVLLYVVNMSKKNCTSRLINKCAVVNCSSVKIKNIFDSSGLMLHNFPKQIELQKDWLSIIGRNDLMTKASSTLNKQFFLCSKHFKAECYSKSGRLKPSSIPSIFDDAMIDANTAKGLF